ncbi:MAG: hypothetical protein A2075_00500 [Geobacteraceae bacterium GWC2_58_44]|nr:MAG: hypothetical protein A2075_00500 [Geobacteraceae bacterium GWC2_58_44]HBG06435.1 hypothetical protein [Geobacter sp.]
MGYIVTVVLRELSQVDQLYNFIRNYEGCIVKSIANDELPPPRMDWAGTPEEQAQKTRLSEERMKKIDRES